MSFLLTLLRHGRSRADDENVHEGRYDSPLTDVGRSQARLLAARWRVEKASFDKIVASPLCRAGETANIIGAALGLKPQFNNDLMERDNGTVAGMPLEQVERQYPEPVPVSPYAPWFGSGESEAEFHRRAGSVLEWLVRLDYQSILVVAHGGILNAVLRNAAGVPLPSSGGAFFMFGDTGFAQLCYDARRHNWSVMRINDTRHLDGDVQVLQENDAPEA
jgi:2,3-bisphosphoglycerate-dependent phosphoglycerate mutase